MEKYRVYELAKELNTTSKRLMEKLEEINVHVKNHMSLLDDHELKALYDHIGVIKHQEKKSDTEDKKAVPVTPPKSEPKKETKNVPRIIRTTEIIIDTKNENDSKPVQQDVHRNEIGKDVRSGNKGNQKNDMFRVADANSGLRMGYTRDNRTDFRRDVMAAQKPETKKDMVKDTPIKDTHQKETRQEVTTPVKPEHKAVNQTPAPVQQNPEQTAHSKTQLPVQQQAQVSAVKPEEKNKIEKETPKVAASEENTIKNQPVNTAGEDINKAPRQSPPSEQQFRRPVSREYEGQRPETQRRDDNRQGAPRNDSRPYQQRPHYDRPQGQGPRGPENRQQGGFQRRPDGRPDNRFSQGQDRQQGSYGRPQGNYGRPQGGPGDNRPSWQNRPQGGPQGGQGRPQGGPSNRFGDRPRPAQNQGGRGLDMPKLDLTEAQKETINSQKTEVRREFANKDVDKDSKREQKKDVPKGQGSDRDKKFKPQKILVEKKGINEILSEDYILNEFYDDSDVKKKKNQRARKDGRVQEVKHIPPRAVLTSITIPETIILKDLAEALKKTSTEVIKKLMGLGMMATLNQELDFDTATLVAEEFKVKTEKAVVVNEEDILFDETEDNEEALEPRPPVVVVMGHVDHGKTSLLDAIRESNVIESEAGGITQHIGAYTVKINNRNITFLDTPGHEAFTAMRARGAQVTDIAIIVVAADDGVMPQTIEAINHAKAANVSIIVAINKIDKPGANPDRVKQELTEYGLVAEEWGGDVICVPVSAKKRQNIDQLLEMVLLTADIMELKVNPNRQAKGTIIEAKLDKDRGPVATMLVQRGTLKVADSLVTGTLVGRIRAMVDDKGHKIKKAGPSTPVEILGLPEVPEAGEVFYAIDDEKIAKQLAEKRKLKQREQQLKSTARITLDDLFNQIKEGKVKDLNIIVKADVQGSVEAVKQSLEKLSNDEVRVKIIHGGVGAITESDITLALVSNAIIIGFNVRPGTNVLEAAKNAGVDMRLYRVIYNAIEDIQAAMKGMLDPTFKEVVLGHAEIRQTFKVSGIGTIAGCYVTDGKIVRASDVRVVRNGIVVHEGKLASLKRFKDDVKEVAQNFECGLSIERFNDIKEADVIEAFTMEEVAR
ncbi:MAG: translation initiation factor IF-2 [Bacillota bacterium]|nr:translation initiation factor IF-2 [Bacillota bacterium]